MLVSNLVDCGVEKRNILFLPLEKWYKIREYEMKLDYLIHDVPNCCLHVKDNGKRWIYIVDTSSIDHVIAEDYDFAFIEGNYGTDEELYEKIKKASEEGKYTHYKRVLETHLSQLQALNWLQKNRIGDYVFIHQHMEKGNENENIK